jgi:CRP-like cAMP-binding protein
MDGGFVSLLGRAEQEALGALGRWRTYRRGDRLFTEGNRSDAVYVVVEGQARVFRTTEEGNEVTLAVRGPGDLVGEMGALDPTVARSATVVALGVLRCRAVAASEMHAFLEHHPRAAMALLQMVIGRLRDADRRRAEFGSYDTTRRLARMLADAATEARSAPAVTLSQRELAGLVGASRESVARALAELRRRGLVATGRRVITVRDAAGLRLYAG